MSAATQAAAPASPSRDCCPLVAVIGLAGGAGATSLAFALAVEAAAAGRPSLIAETADHGLREVGGAASPVGLYELPGLIEAGEWPPVFWAQVDGVRVLTSTAARRAEGSADLGAVIAEARRAHSLVVLDCGRDEPGLAAGRVTHTMYVAPASATGLERAARRLNGTRGRARGRMILAVVAVHSAARPRARDIRRLAESHCDTVVLAPHHPQLVTQPHEAHDLLRATACDLLSAITSSR